MTQADAAVEINFDGLVGPTHNHAGLGPGNLASGAHRARPSNPRAAAKQGLAKMRRLRRLGVPQAVLPPQPRPNVSLLRRLGFSGRDAAVLRAAGRQAPHLLAAACSGACMWTANAATVGPSADTMDGRVHFTPANLAASLHRAAEAAATAATLRAVFLEGPYFVHHPPLPAAANLGDEGAANHTRLSTGLGQPGLQLFVYGDDGQGTGVVPRRFRPRQAGDTSRAVARLHQLDPARVVFARQHPDAIDAGVFHHDVIGVGHRDRLLVHESAFADRAATLDTLRHMGSEWLRIEEVPAARLPLADAVSTYLFNSQLVTAADGRLVLVAPRQCEAHTGVRGLVDGLAASGFLDDAVFVDVNESMGNGGGPACLRLRVELTPEQRAAVHPGVVLDDRLDAALDAWIDRHHRDLLTPDDLADPSLLRESRDAMADLAEILRLGDAWLDAVDGS